MGQWIDHIHGPRSNWLCFNFTPKAERGKKKGRGSFRESGLSPEQRSCVSSAPSVPNRIPGRDSLVASTAGSLVLFMDKGVNTLRQ